MTSDRKRKRLIRALMAETGLKYTQAARQVDEEWARSQAEPAEDASSATDVD